MAITALHSAASALSALNTSLDVTSNNLANVNTPGFKPSRVNFQDLMYVEQAAAGSKNANGDQRPIGIYVGLGVEVAGTQVDFAANTGVIPTGRPLDLTINEGGFFKVTAQEQPGGFAYTRAGHFTRNADGEVVLASDQGRRLDPNLTIPQNASGITIDANGLVTANIPGQVTPQEIGQIELTMFINPSGLKQIGENLWVETGASGPAINGVPGTENFGTLQQGQLEASGTDPTRELIDLIKTQRAFEMNSNTIRTADETLRTVSQLKR